MQKKEAEKSFTKRTIEKFYFPLLLFLQITYFAHIFLSRRGKFQSKWWGFQKDVKNQKELEADYFTEALVSPIE